MSDPRTVLDASALLALLADETGSELAVEALRNGCVMSAVNVAEVAAKLHEAGVPPKEIEGIFENLQIEILPFDRVDALKTGDLRPATRKLGLSLGDRACLAAAERLSLRVLTADRTWSEVPLAVEIVVMR